MTADDKPAFLQAIARLAIALREKEPDVVQLRIYFDALTDLELPFVVEAAHRLEKTAQWFPKTSEWRMEAERLRAERLEQQRAWLRESGKPLCSVCEDTGWEMVRTVENGHPVTRAKACACREQRHRELTGAANLPALPPRSSEHQDAIVDAAVKELAESHAMPALSDPQRATVVNISERRDR
jgi:hypothetical protein